MTVFEIDRDTLKRCAKHLGARGVVLPTFGQQQDPAKVPSAVKDRLRGLGLWDLHPLNLFRITWKNQAVSHGGLFDGVNWLEIPAGITGVRAKIFALIGKWFPTGSHKVGATYGCLIRRLVAGKYDPTRQKAVWPSTGNFCRGGAYNAAVIGCDSVAILPEGMSRERFEWLSKIAGEVIATPGSESNVKEIYDKCHELRRSRPEVVIFNQFEDFGNYLWHYHVTGRAIEEVFTRSCSARENPAGVVLASGSAGTLACADYLKERFPRLKLAVVEAVQCPTLLLNGYGSHRIEGIGDKHVPWIHNVRNTDMVIAVDDESCMRVLRLLNEPAGLDFLASRGLDEEQIRKLPLLGISSVGNLLGAIKFARYYELTEKDVVFTVLTDSMELYASRLAELRQSRGAYTREEAVRDYYGDLVGQSLDHLLELNHYDRKRIHHLKYYTWVEQQGRDVSELDAQWYDYPDYWRKISAQVHRIDEGIEELNHLAGTTE
jgi:cysteine synthase A